MALINCSECKQEISDKATSCPHCGSPIKTTPQIMEVVTNKENPPVFQLELTAKKWKKVILTAWAMLFGGFFLMAIFVKDTQTAQGVGMLIFFVSGVTWIVGRIGAWYSNR